MGHENLSCSREQDSRDWFADVLEFHRKFRPHLIGKEPHTLLGADKSFRLDLIWEEWQELLASLNSSDVPATADALADLIYVTIGLAVTAGIDLRPVWAAVHAANMRKVLSPSRPDGKVLKPEGWTPPDVAGILALQKPLV